MYITCTHTHIHTHTHMVTYTHRCHPAHKRSNLKVGCALTIYTIRYIASLYWHIHTYTYTHYILTHAHTQAWTHTHTHTHTHTVTYIHRCHPVHKRTNLKVGCALTYYTTRYAVLAHTHVHILTIYSPMHTCKCKHTHTHSTESFSHSQNRNRCTKSDPWFIFSTNLDGLFLFSRTRGDTPWRDPVLCASGVVEDAAITDMLRSVLWPLWNHARPTLLPAMLNMVGRLPPWDILSGCIIAEFSSLGLALLGPGRVHQKEPAGKNRVQICACAQLGNGFGHRTRMHCKFRTNRCIAIIYKV